MVKRHMQLSFREEDEGVYQYIKSHRHPSEFVLEAVKYYRIANPKSDTEVIPLDSLISDQIKIQLKDYLENMGVAPLVQQATERVEVIATLEEDTSTYDFSEALAMFDDDE